MSNEEAVRTPFVDVLPVLETLLQVTFNDSLLLRRALTHHSCCPGTAIRDSYDTLEFLGDAIIAAHVVEYIYRTFPEASEGEMTALKSEVVSRRVLARIGQTLGLFPYIRVDVANLRTFNERSLNFTWSSVSNVSRTSTKGAPTASSLLIWHYYISRSRTASRLSYVDTVYNERYLINVAAILKAGEELKIKR